MRALDTSYWLSLDVREVTPVDAVTDDVEVEFRTVQAAAKGPDGQTCSDWVLRYRLTLDSGFWRIDRATPVGADPARCTATVPPS